MTTTKIASPRNNLVKPPLTSSGQEPASEVDIETLMTNAGWLDTHTREEIRATLGCKIVSRGNCGLRRR